MRICRINRQFRNHPINNHLCICIGVNRNNCVAQRAVILTRFFSTLHTLNSHQTVCRKLQLILTLNEYKSYLLWLKTKQSFELLSCALVCFSSSDQSNLCPFLNCCQRYNPVATVRALVTSNACNIAAQSVLIADNLIRAVTYFVAFFRNNHKAIRVFDQRLNHFHTRISAAHRYTHAQRFQIAIATVIRIASGCRTRERCGEHIVHRVRHNRPVRRQNDTQYLAGIGSATNNLGAFEISCRHNHRASRVTTNERLIAILLNTCGNLCRATCVCHNLKRFCL